MAHILITGATGFIGTSLALKLANAGHNIHALYRSEAKAKKLQHPNIQLFKGDVLNEKSMSLAMESCTQIYHLAALANLWAKDADSFTRVNVEATRNLLEMAKAKDVQRLVITSTAGVIGPSTKGQFVDENTIRTTPHFGDYEITKKRAEDFISTFDAGKMKVVIVNPTRVYGPGELTVSNGVTRMVKLYLEGKMRFIPGKGDKIGNYVFVEDVVDGHILAMEKGRHKERYLLGGENILYADFFEKLAAVSGKKYRQFNIPTSIIFSMAHFMEWRATKFGIPPLLTPDWARKFLHYDWNVSSQKAEKELGYKITSLEEGLRKTVAWIG